MNTSSRNEQSLKTIQSQLHDIFLSLCGDYPGAVSVRHSYGIFKEFVTIDEEEHGLTSNERQPMKLPTDVPGPPISQREGDGSRGQRSQSTYVDATSQITSSRPIPASSVISKTYKRPQGTFR